MLGLWPARSGRRASEIEKKPPAPWVRRGHSREKRKITRWRPSPGRATSSGNRIAASRPRHTEIITPGNLIGAGKLVSPCVAGDRSDCVRRKRHARRGPVLEDSAKTTRSSNTRMASLAENFAASEGAASDAGRPNATYRPDDEPAPEGSLTLPGSSLPRGMTSERLARPEGRPATNHNAADDTPTAQTAAQDTQTAAQGSCMHISEQRRPDARSPEVAGLPRPAVGQ
jgi:hypothetical protein